MVKNKEIKKVAILSNNIECDRHIQYYGRVEKYFISNGWSIQTDFKVDKAVICGCGFHDFMYEKVSRLINKLKNEAISEKNIIVMACLPKTHEAELKANFNVTLVPIYKESILDDIIEAEIPFKEIIPQNMYKPYGGIDPKKKGEFFYIKIEEGCLQECTFCVINKAKGRIRSVPENEIEKQFIQAVKEGHRKIFLMGEDTFAYGYDNQKNILELVEHLLSIDPNVEFYFGHLHIRWFEKYAEGILSLCKRGIIKKLHVGLQHVDDELLKKMGRPAEFSKIYNIIRNLKSECPDVFLSADIMVGFHGETKEKFEKLLEFFKEDRYFSNISHFGFSDVKGAKSYVMEDKVDPLKIVMRWEQLKKVLGNRSYYNPSGNSECAEEEYRAIYQQTLDKDYFFLKDSYVETSKN
jgi:ribosomal protein S12 methylthiotransferase